MHYFDSHFWSLAVFESTLPLSSSCDRIWASSLRESLMRRGEEILPPPAFQPSRC
ncbi:MAG: hypothetical protein KME57_12290 [Scytonema hyalinum WJT4-NPBG1]|nr:hypothetical protein [Scytonema hyalinum WJT4-NPBG1]